MHELGDTIVARATPPGRGAVGCIRLSGPEAHAIGRRLFAPAGREPEPDGALRFGTFLGRGGSPVDHGYLVLFPEARSSTGEPVAELWAHGSPAVLAELVEVAVQLGARPAGPGEFTYRALRHGKLDLARAEAIRDLVEARTRYQARLAFAQLQGELSRRLAPMREALAEWIARGEAAVEFVDEAETHAAAAALDRALAELTESATRLLAGFQRGRIVREGAIVAITGRPNVGKSSLFNRLLERERAIVTETPGTTRDLLEESLDLEGVAVRLVDTAGLRATSDPAEQEGVRRAERAAAEADLVLVVLDGSRAPLDTDEREPLEGPRAGRRLVVINKCDLQAHPFYRTAPWLRVSARTGEGLDALRQALLERLLGEGPVEDPIVTDARHAAALEAARAALLQGRQALAEGFTEEVVLEHLREAMAQLGTITGEFTTEDLYDRIFSTFCIGK